MNPNTEHENELRNCREQVSQLLEENAELIGSLRIINEKLRDSERLKGHFISNITNEIINPFSSVLALASNIQKLKEGEISSAHRMAELIFEEAFHLDFQFKNIFAAALIEAGNDELKISTFNLGELSNHLQTYFSEQLKKKKINFLVRYSNESKSDEPKVFTTDREKLDLIIRNLISNSIKFSPESSSIEMEYIVRDGELSVEISDHGKGIQPGDRKIIFDRFKQLDEKINSINTGHGLGLSVVMAYTEMLGGKVSMDDNYDGGLRMIVTVPLTTEPHVWDDLEGFLLDSETSY